jgi:hypothetical protein
MAEDKERFLSRWARLKQQAQEDDTTQPGASAPAPERDAPPPELPPLEQLNLDSDYGGFFHPKVDENLRRAALKRLFSDPHFNVMDGLDVYIDDYSKPSPLPAEMLATLRQAQKILAWAKEGKEEEKKEVHAAVPSKEQSALDVQPVDQAVPGAGVGPNGAVEPVEAVAPVAPERKS